jgi:hypothetical protein
MGYEDPPNSFIHASVEKSGKELITLLTVANQSSKIIVKVKDKGDGASMLEGPA